MELGGDHKGKYHNEQPAQDMGARHKILFLQRLSAMDDHESLVVRCGRCGQHVRVALADLVGLTTFECRRCRPLSNRQSPTSVFAEGDLATTALLAGIVKELSQVERWMMIRKSAGFSDRDVSKLYGATLTELDELVKRLTDRVRSIHSRRKDHKRP